jgi:microcystin-dependent protein
MGSHALGESGGEASHTLSQAEMPTHIHVVQASTLAGNSTNPRFGSDGHVFASDPGNCYSPSAGAVPLNPASISNAGGSQPHENRQPFLVLNFCIALQGIFPSRN